MAFEKQTSDTEILEAMARNGGNKKRSARELGMNYGHFRRRINQIAVNDPDDSITPPNQKVLPDGHELKGVSTLLDKDGNQRLQWVKTKQDEAARQELFEEFLKGCKEKIPKEKPTSRIVRQGGDDLCNLYVLTDYHLGMLSWREETGEDWDARIAEDMMTEFFKLAIQRAPKARQAVLAQLGDFLHYDSLEAVTPQNRNILDTDTRPALMVRVAVRAMRRVIRMLLQSHDSVHVIMAEGNHDPMSSVWLRECFAQFYDNESRLTVDLSPAPYYAYKWGESSLFFHHGHKRPPKRVDEVFASMFRDVYGQTKHSYAHVGHLHNEQVVESPLMLVQQHRTLTGKSSFEMRGGWNSERAAQVHIYHVEHGRVGMIEITPEMIGV